jgi:hypothetical protein
MLGSKKFLTTNSNNAVASLADTSAGALGSCRKWPRHILSCATTTRSRAGVGVAQGLVGLQLATGRALGGDDGSMAATPAVPSEAGKWRLLLKLGSCMAAGAGSPRALSEESWQ